MSDQNHLMTARTNWTIRDEEATVYRLHYNESATKRGMSCESCNNGESVHNWPEG